MEDSWTSLIGGLLAASRALSARARHDESEPRIFKESEDDEDDQDIDEDGGSEGTESSSHSSHKNQTFDRHLVLVGCQTFQVKTVSIARLLHLPDFTFEISTNQHKLSRNSSIDIQKF